MRTSALTEANFGSRLARILSIGSNHASPIASGPLDDGVDVQVTFATTVTSDASADITRSVTAANVVTPRKDTMTYKLKVNGTVHDVDVDGDTPLLWVLRDVLGMTGTKFGCGQALCGACTVHLEGAPIRSCITPIESVDGKAITTIDAVGKTPAGSEIQK